MGNAMTDSDTVQTSGEDASHTSRRVAGLIALGFRAQTPVLVLALAYLGIQLLLAALFPPMTTASPQTVFLAVISMVLGLLFFLVIILSAYLFIIMAVYERPKRPTVHLIRRMAAVIRSPRNLASGLPIFVSTLILVYAFSRIKGSIPFIAPFSWDMTLDHLDLVLHFGRRPWEWLHPILGHWPVTFVISVIYNLWFAVMYGVWLHYAFMERPGMQRTRYFLTFVLLWMVAGSLLALLLSSAGPCFYGEGRLGLSPDPYAPLVTYLHAVNEIVPIWALSIQDMLWKLHLSNLMESSISAMPSLHNATSLLFVLASRGWPRWVRALLVAHCAVVFIGSVHLAWHYAVDSYVGWAVTILLWWLMAPVARWWESRPAARRFQHAYQASAS